MKVMSFVEQQHQTLVEENMSNLTSASGEASVSSNHQSSLASPNPYTNPQKKRRSLPGNPDPEAEVIALSPKSLLATNRFMCEICNKGFQRDQNLQLHRRGHNLPWKLKQRSSKEVRKKVYICPETTCVHHDPSRALGDLTGIKKHFCRKHWEKKWKCDKCSKKYAVQSDWKAHSKTCGTKEYRCDCGTHFSRRDSFITHRAFCDALAEESARVISSNHNNIPTNHHPFLFSLPPTSHHIDHHHITTPLASFTTTTQELTPKKEHLHLHHHQEELNNMRQDVALAPWLGPQTTFMNHFDLDLPTTLFSTKLRPNINTNTNNNIGVTCSSLPPPPSPHMSATALLQRAAQMGATMSRPGASTEIGHNPLMSESFVHGSVPPPHHPTLLYDMARSGFDGSFGEAFGEMLAPKREERSGENIEIGGKDDGMTRDFLGLTSLSQSDILNIAGFDPSYRPPQQPSKEPTWHA